MAKYENTRVLKKATPTVRTSDGVVKTWDLEAVFSTVPSANVKAWSTTYSAREDVEYLDKTPSEFTKAELLALFPTNLDVIFDAHYEAHNLPPVDERVSDFNLNDLA